LNAVLGFTGDKKIVSITLLNPFQLPELVHYKTTVIDVKATDQSGHYYIIEMQVADKGNFAKRIELYSSKACTMQIGQGNDYHLIKPVIFIGILNFNFLDTQKYLAKHVVCDIETKVLNAKRKVMEIFLYTFFITTYFFLKINRYCR